MERILLPYFKNGAVGSSFFHFHNAPYPPFHMLKISSLKKTSLPSLYSPPKTHFLHHAQNFPFPYLNTTLIPVRWIFFFSLSKTNFDNFPSSKVRVFSRKSIVAWGSFPKIFPIPYHAYRVPFLEWPPSMCMHGGNLLSFIGAWFFQSHICAPFLFPYSWQPVSSCKIKIKRKKWRK